MEIEDYLKAEKLVNKVIEIRDKYQIAPDIRMSVWIRIDGARGKDVKILVDRRGNETIGVDEPRDATGGLTGMREKIAQLTDRYLALYNKIIKNEIEAIETEIASI